MKRFFVCMAALLITSSLVSCHSIEDYKTAATELKDILTADDTEQSFLSRELCSALNLNNFSLVKQAIEDGADVSILSGDGTLRTSSVLLMAFYCECSDEVINYLKEQGSNSATGASTSDWWDLIVNGGYKQIELLIQDVFDFNQKSITGMTSFSSAIATGSNTDEEEFRILTALFQSGYKITKSDFKIACMDGSSMRSFLHDPKTARLIVEQLEKQGNLNYATKQFVDECKGNSIKSHREFSTSDLALITAFGSADDLDFVLAHSTVNKATLHELSAKSVEYGNQKTFDYLTSKGYIPYYHDDTITIAPDVQTCIDNDSTALLKQATITAPEYFYSRIVNTAETLEDASIFEDFFYRTKPKITDLTPFCMNNTKTGRELFEFAAKHCTTLTASKVYSGVAERFLELGGSKESVLQGIIVDPNAYMNEDFLRSLVEDYNVDFGDYGHTLLLQAIRAGSNNTVEYLASLGFTLDYDSLYADNSIKGYNELLFYDQRDEKDP